MTRYQSIIPRAFKKSSQAHYFKIITINSLKSNNFLQHVIQNSTQSHQLIRMPRLSFRSVMVAVTFYDGSINVLDNLNFTVLSATTFE